MKRKTLSICIVCLILQMCSFTGCSDDKSKDTPENAPTVSESETSVISQDSSEISYGNLLCPSVFKYCNILKEVYIGKDTFKIGESPFSGCRLLRKIEAAVNNRYFRTDEEDHALYNKNRSKPICFPASIVIF